MAQPVSFNISVEKEASKIQFFRRQLTKEPPMISRHDVDLAGKTAVVTGANGGIGLECARQLLALGIGKIVLTVRDEAKGEAARETLAAGLEPGQTVEVWRLDLASYESITAFAQRVRDDLHPRLDIAILSAGVQRVAFGLNPNTGHEEDLQTNYLSTVLLALLLLDGFKKASVSSSQSPSPPSPSPRIVVVSSDTAAWTPFHERHTQPLLKAFDSLDAAKWNAIQRYATTKLLGQLFVTELARRVPPALAVVNCANPGLAHGTMLNHECGLVVGVFTRVFGRPAAVGARSIVHAAAKQDERSHGQYVEDGEIRPMAPFVYSKEAEQITRRLWEETMDELAFAGARDIVESLG